MSIKLKALVDKANNKVIFAESDEDFVDVLLSFLTMPIGTIVKLTLHHGPNMPIGSFSNLYESVQKLDDRRLKNKACKTMLLHPQNGYGPKLKDLKLKIDELPYFLLCAKCKLLRHYEDSSTCDCGLRMRLTSITKNGFDKVELDSADEGVFVKEYTRFLISDELKVLPPSTSTSFSMISKLGIMDASSIEERIFNIQEHAVLRLLKWSLLSKFPLTQTLLEPKELPDLRREISDSMSDEIEHQNRGNVSKENGEICIKLMLSKSKKRVCYAEVDDDFVDLLFSFLTIPLGYIIKEMHGASSKGLGSINNLYSSTKDLDCEKYFKSNDHKQILLNPKVYPDYCYENNLLGVEKAAPQQYYFVSVGVGHSLRETISMEKPSSGTAVALSFEDPKPQHKRAKTGGRFVMGHAMFTVTDDLIVTPISPVSGVSVLNKLNIPFDDIEERIVCVGKEEACKLLVTSLVSESALTETFLLKKVKHEY